MKAATEDEDTTIRQKIEPYSQSVEYLLEERKPKNHIPVLDGVRAVACLAILSYHLNYIARSYDIWHFPQYGTNHLMAALSFFVASLAYFGESGVILFFLLSGFLLFLPYARSLLFDSSWPSLRRFYVRRIFRILPGYYVALFLLALFFRPEFLRRDHWQGLWLFMTFRMDFQLSVQLNGPFWTLATEFQFYLLLPLIAWLFGLIVRRGTLQWRMFKLSLCLLLLTAWGLLTKYWGLFLADTPKLDFLISHTVSTALKPYVYGNTEDVASGKFFEVFAVGMLIGMVYTYTQYSPSAEDWSTRMRRLSPLMFTSGLIILSLLSLWHFYYRSVIYQYTEYNLFLRFFAPNAAKIVYSWLQWQAIAYTLSYGLCLLALLYGSYRIKRPFEWPILRWIGLISFSLYMWHMMFMYLFAWAVNYNIRKQGWGIIMQYSAFCFWTLVVILPVSIMLYHWVEKPGMRLGELLVRKLDGQKKRPIVVT